MVVVGGLGSGAFIMNSIWSCDLALVEEFGGIKHSDGGERPGGGVWGVKCSNGGECEGTRGVIRG
jgi:hypothetical protein